MMQEVMQHGAPPGLPPGYCSPQQRDMDGSRGLFRTRKPNWTEPETLLLVTLVDKHCILRTRLMDYNTNQQKTEVWCTITALINQRNSTVLRTVDEVKRRWQNVYSIAKREASEYHLAVKNKTPHMSTPQLHQFLCPISMRLVEIFGGIDSFGSQQHIGALTLTQFEPRSNSSSEKSSVESCPAAPRIARASSDAPLVLPELSPHPQRAIKREASNGETLEAAWPTYDRRTFTNFEPCSPRSVPDLSAAPYAKQPRLSPATAQAATQTETEDEAQLLRLEMLRSERDLLRLRVERARVRLERDRMRFRKEEEHRELKLDRLRRHNDDHSEGQSEQQPDESPA